MKNLNSEGLLRYRVNSQEVNIPTSNVLLPNLTAKIQLFAFPISESENENQPKLLTQVFTYSENKEKKAEIAIAVINDSGIRTVASSEVYKVQERLQREEECFVWEYNQLREKLRSVGFKNLTGNNFDMNGSLQHFSEFNGKLPPLQEAYNKKVQKNKGYLYSRGTIGEWSFIHFQTKEPFPWETLKIISHKEFGTEADIEVFFNYETKKHPADYIIWQKM